VKWLNKLRATSAGISTGAVRVDSARAPRRAAARWPARVPTAAADSRSSTARAAVYQWPLCIDSPSTAMAAQEMT
jgi:hypothetical protein